MHHFPLTAPGEAQIAQHCKAKGQVCAAGREEVWQGKHEGMVGL